MFTVLAVATFGVGTLLLAAQEGGPPELFTDAPTPGDAARGDAAIVRTRFVSVNVDAIGRAGALPGHPSASTDEVQLNLFPDVRLTAVRERVEPTSSGTGVIWTGRVRGAEPSVVTLVVDDGLLVGDVRLGVQAFEIRPGGGGVHMIHEIETARFPPD